jgi:3-hydroxy-9,10-secoandrosta-1,3,5(10)-triene-9,17-dione monooxygenase reductase component
MTTSRAAVDDQLRFRRVMGHFPTGVVVITAIDAGGTPVGMTVGSFTSVSLAPPLVAFLPAKRSTSFPRIREARQFCVNVLARTQEAICRAMSSPVADRFGAVDWAPSAETGSPIIKGVLAWIDCLIDAVHAAGDHYIVVGRVIDFDVPVPGTPLLFFRGGYGRFAGGDE